MKNWNRLLNLSVLIHTILRMNINQLGYVNAIKVLSKNFISVLNAVNTFPPLSTRQIKKIAATIITDDNKDMLVTSCISISLLVHILCLLSKINSEIVIGVTIINGKVFSHAWVETHDETFDFMSEGYNYKVIKKFSLLDRSLSD